jgi:inositol 1,4,5-triphosphate receptor type 1
LRKAIDFYYSNTAHIDVMRGNRLEMVYFPLLPYCKDLPKEKKTNFQEVVDRSNVKSKVTALTEISTDYIEIMKHENYL